jgi:hypothetical protein
VCLALACISISMIKCYFRLLVYCFFNVNWMEGLFQNDGKYMIEDLKILTDTCCDFSDSFYKRLPNRSLSNHCIVIHC